MSWLERLFGVSRYADRSVIADRCPNPTCGWAEPIVVSKLATIMHTERRALSEASGHLCRCPICRKLYVHTKAGTRLCDETLEPAASTPPQHVPPERKPQAYPRVPEDMASAWMSREPR
jgi:predicted anti-sigma-YlaC factor YlaD